MNVVALHKRRSNEAAEALTHFLKLAEDGEVTAVAIAGLAPDGTPMVACNASADSNIATLIGALHMLAAQLTANQIGGDDE